VVVGAVVDADPALGDGLPSHGQQFEVIAAGQGDGDVPGDADQRGPHLVRSECGAGQDGVAQPFVGAHVPVDEPFVEEVLQLGDGVAGVVFDVAAAAGDVGAGVAGQVLAEQGVDGVEGALDDAFGGGGVRRGGLHADPEGLARGGERRRQVDLPSVHDDGFGDDDGAGHSSGEALVQGEQPLVGGQFGVGEAQGVGPRRPCGVRDGHLGEQQGRVDGLGGAGGQDGGEDGAGGDVDGDRELGAAGWFRRRTGPGRPGGWCRSAPAPRAAARWWE
jgi:hypothetical protein